VVFKMRFVNQKPTLVFQSDLAGTAVIKIFNLAGRCVHSQTIAVMPGKTENIACYGSLFTRGVYIGVAKFSGVHGKITQRIERFEVH